MTFCCSNEAAVSILRGFYEVVGGEGVAQMEPVLSAGRQDLTPMLTGLEHTYGPAAAYGIARQAGRAAFGHWLHTAGKKAGMSGLDFRLQPGGRRLERGLHMIAAYLSEQCGLEVRTAGQEGRWVWSLPACSPGCGCSCTCQWTMGFVQEYLAWSSGGRFFPIEHVRGEQTCTLMIQQKPVD